MTTPFERTIFERSLLASRLVDPAHLAELASEIYANPLTAGSSPESQAPATTSANEANSTTANSTASSTATQADFDKLLAESLIEHRLLNAWQVEQLRQGRTKFSLGPYRIIDAIGSGGMGHVFKGEHELLGRVEAIKVLPKARTTPESITSFRHEIRVQAQLDHPNLVRVSYADRDGETYFLVTEFVPGIDLRRLVRRCGAMPADVAAYLLVQAADGLEFAHRRGLVHRDIKPGNLLVTPEGHVKVTDLGLAWYLDDELMPSPLTAGKIVGTCDYLPPEVIRRPDRITPVSDLYALGCTLYYAVTGKVPYPGGTASQKMKRRLREEPVNPLSLAPDLPAGMVELLAQMMHKNPNRRTPSAKIAADRLREFIHEDSQQSATQLIAQFAHRRAKSGSSATGEIPDTVDAPLVDEDSDQRSSEAIPASEIFGSPDSTALTAIHHHADRFDSEPSSESVTAGNLVEAEQQTSRMASAEQETVRVDRSPPSEELATGEPPAPARVADRVAKITVAVALLATVAILIVAVVQNL